MPGSDSWQLGATLLSNARRVSRISRRVAPFAPAAEARVDFSRSRAASLGVVSSSAQSPRYAFLSLFRQPCPLPIPRPPDPRCVGSDRTRANRQERAPSPRKRAWLDTGSHFQSPGMIDSARLGLLAKCGGQQFPKIGTLDV